MFFVLYRLVDKLLNIGKYLGFILWSRLIIVNRLVISLVSFKNRIRKYDFSFLLDNGCRGCVYCNS